MCGCPASVRDRRPILPAVGSGAVVVTVVLCRCDMRQCSRKDCGAYAKWLGARVCTNGHSLN